MSVEAQIAELRARLSLLQGTPTLLLAVAQSDAVVDETRRILLEMLRATPLELADLGPCKIDTGPARWAELTRQHADAVAYALTFIPTTTLEAKVFAQRLNAERQWLRELAGPVVFVVSRTTERALRQHAQDFVTWVAHSDELPAPQELAALAPRLGVSQAAVTPKLPPEPPVRFLHISDLHLDASRRYDQDRVLDGLLTFLERDRTGFALDLVFVTGDLASTGKPAQYELVVALFKELMLRTGVPAERFFVVPGNHDADREVGRWLLRTLSSDAEATAFFEDARSRQFHAQKLAAYQQSMQALLGATRPLGIGVGEDSVEIVEIRGARLAVAAFNSAWFAQGDDDREKLWVGEANVMRAVDRIADEEATFAVAMLHHPFKDLHPLDRELVEPWMERGFDLVLRGHLHADKTRSIVTQRGGFVELAAPAAYQGSSWGNGCFLGEIRPRERTVRVRPFMYTAGPDPWVLDPRVFPDDAEEGYCRTFAVPAKRRIKSAVGRPLRAATAAAMRSLPIERQKAIERQAGQNSDQLASELSQEDLMRGVTYLGNMGGWDSGIGWVAAITRAGEDLDFAGRITVKDVDTLQDALTAAGRLFWAAAARRKVKKDLYERTCRAAFTAAFAAVVNGRVMPEQEFGDRPRSGRADILLETMGRRVVINIARETSETILLTEGLDRLSRSIDLAGAELGALVLLGPLAITSSGPKITRATSATGMPILIVVL